VISSWRTWQWLTS